MCNLWLEIAECAAILIVDDLYFQYNGMNFRSVTHEQALVEISKPADMVSILAQYNIQSEYSVGTRMKIFQIFV